jgi:TRAP-type C4-dicarboxylate transport system substrate-binding protein
VTEGGLFERKLSRETAKKFRQDLISKGMQINDVPAATLSKMQDLTKPTIEKFSALYDPTLVNLYRSEMARIYKAIP